MRKSQNRLSDDIRQVKLPSYLELCRDGKTNVFVRNRKISVDDLILSMINRKGVTLYMELRSYMEIAHPEIKISKVAYLKQRMNLNPMAIEYLYKRHNCAFYLDSEETPTLYNGYLVLAADGSDINIPTTSETIELYGTAGRKDVKPQAQAGLGCLYDVLNRFVIDASINRVKFHEMAIAEQQIYKVKETIGDRYPFMVTMDRGYVSIASFLRLMDCHIPFVVRLKSSDFKAEKKAMKSDDEDVTIAITNSRRNNYIGTPDESIITRQDSFQLRFVRVTLETGETEVLATTLSREEFPADSFGEIYHMRWGIETAFQSLKDRLQLENFTGTKPRLIEQDIYATIYVSNLSEDIIRDIEIENKEKLENGYMHKMMINRNISFGILKNDLISTILTADYDEQKRKFQAIYDELAQNIIPIRNGRHFHRTKGVLVGKYSNTHKRSY